MRVRVLDIEQKSWYVLKNQLIDLGGKIISQHPHSLRIDIEAQFASAKKKDDFERIARRFGRVR